MLIFTSQESCSINRLLARVLSFVYLERRDTRIQGSRVPLHAMHGHSPGVVQLSLYIYGKHDDAAKK